MSRWFTIATALVVLSTCMLAPAGPAAAKQRACAGASAAPTATTLPRAYAAVLCLVNRERARRRLLALRSSAPLTQAAVGHSTDMVANEYFAHDSLAGTTPRQRVVRAGYFAGNAGGNVEEALACGWMQLSSPRALVSMLMRSRLHQGILLSRSLRDIGVGLVLGGPQPAVGGGGATLTLDLARR
jgi:uncharacterized protein YkwD